MMTRSYCAGRSIIAGVDDIVHSVSSACTSYFISHVWIWPGDKCSAISCRFLKAYAIIRSANCAAHLEFPIPCRARPFRLQSWPDNILEGSQGLGPKRNTLCCFSMNLVDKDIHYGNASLSSGRSPVSGPVGCPHSESKVSYDEIHGLLLSLEGNIGNAHYEYVCAHAPLQH